MIIGHGLYKYKVLKDWSKADSEHYPVADCHEMVLDKQGRLFLLTTETKNNILIYNQNGEVTGSWGHTYPGAHGLSIGEEPNGEEFLLITDIERHQVIKTSLTGEELMVIEYPSMINDYESKEQFNPTETAIAKNGNIYVTDGYGLQFVIQYDSSGKYIRHWGGKGRENHQFDCVHGIAIDYRKSEPTLIITSRNENVFKRFTMDGQYISTIKLPGSFVCRPVIKDDKLYAAVFRSGTNMNFGSGYITILDENDRVISTPGGSEPIYENGVLQTQHQAVDAFIHPHDVCILPDKSIIVCQWKAGGLYPIKLEPVS